jgi:hypothetical protein
MGTVALDGSSPGKFAFHNAKGWRDEAINIIS